MIAAYTIIALVAIQRVAELVLATRNTEALLRRGAIEIGKDHYPLIVLFHATWLVVIAVWLPQPVTIHAIPLICFILLQAARIWVIATLGPYWTTRIITLENAPLVRRGPYRFLRHPNYVVVALEVFTLPLVFGETGVALICAGINLGLLFWRIRIEETALGARRAISEGAMLKS
ncbi:MAG: isoprenylcysteine carboxylmethyltransferase family protein [Alphaproteobacteria bacterium]